MRPSLRRSRIQLCLECATFWVFSSSAFQAPTIGSSYLVSNRATRTFWAGTHPWLAATKNAIIAKDERTEPRKVGRPRELLEFLQRRYDYGSSVSSDKEKQWKKLQMYLYQSHHLLSWEQVEAVVDFLDSRVAPATSRKILQANPRVLRKSVGSFLAPTADFLLDLWGPDLFQTAMEQNPKLLLARGVGYSQRTDQDEKQVIQILTAAGLSLTAIQDLKRTAPFVFGLSIQKMESVLSFLMTLLQADGTLSYEPNEKIMSLSKHRKTVAGIISSHPYLLNLSVEGNLQTRVEFLQTACQMNMTDVAKMVRTSKGTVLNLAIEENLQPTLTFLKATLAVDGGVSTDVLRKCLLSHPQVLTLSLSNLRTKVEYFSELEKSESKNNGVKRESSGSSLAARILRRCPTVYSLSLKDNIVPKVDILSRVWGVSSQLGYDSSCSSLSKMLQEFPNILTSSLDGNILPTLNFFNRTGYIQLTDDWELAPGSPRIPGRYLGASLYNRLLPRWHYCLAQGSSGAMGKNGGTLMPSNPPSLNLLVLANDLKFCDSLGLDLGDYLEFKEAAIPRLKFSSQFDTWVKTGRPIQV